MTTRLRNVLRCAPLCAAGLFVGDSLHADDGTRWHEPLLRLISSNYREAIATRDRLRDELATLPDTPRNRQSGRLGYQLWGGGQQFQIPFPAWVEIELDEEVEMDAVVLVPVDTPYRDFPGPGYGFPVRFRVEVFGGGTERIIADHIAQAFPNPGGLPLWIPTPGIRGQRVRLTMVEPWRHGRADEPRQDVLAIGEIMVMRGNRNLAVGARVDAREAFESRDVWGKANLTDGQSLLGAPVVRQRSPTLGYHSTIVDTPDEVKWVQVDLGASYPLDEIRLIGAMVVQFSGRPGFGFPVRFKIESSDEPEFARTRLLVDQTTQDFANPASNPVTFRLRGATGRYVRVTATRLWERAENFTFALAELQVYSGEHNVAAGRPVSFLDRYPSTSGAWMPQNLTDGQTSEHALTEWPDWIRGLSRKREVLAELVSAERTVAQATTTADARLLRAALFAGLAGVGGLLIAVRRSRRTRQRELERLRKRIAADLHDEIGSNLGSIALLCELGQRRKSDPERVRSDLAEIGRVARQTSDSMRDIVELIERPAVTGEDFVARLREIANRMLAGTEWTFELAAPLELPSLVAQRHLLLAFKEALHNVHKHAGARHVAITLRQESGCLRLQVTDDGAGFEPAHVVEGHGLTSLRHRAAALGGELELTSRPGGGTTVTLSAQAHALRTTQP